MVLPAYMGLRAPLAGPWTSGFLSGAGSNVEGSTGADSDPMSFYCTTSATTWKYPSAAFGLRCVRTPCPVTLLPCGPSTPIGVHSLPGHGTKQLRYFLQENGEHR